jgi:hypothetical protein
MYSCGPCKLRHRVLKHSAKFKKIVMCNLTFIRYGQCQCQFFCKSEACTIFKMPQLNELQKSIIIIRTRLEEEMSIRHMANEINVDKNTILLAKEKLRKLKLLEKRDIVGILLILNVVLKLYQSGREYQTLMKICV